METRQSNQSRLRRGHVRHSTGSQFPDSTEVGVNRTTTLTREGDQKIMPCFLPNRSAASFLIVAALALVTSASSAWCQPVITKQPVDQSVSVGAIASFKVTATTAQPPLTYEWRFGAVPLSAMTNTLVLSNVTQAAVGGYSVIVADGSGSVTSRVAALVVDSTFTKVSTGPVATDLDYGWGCSWGDYDNDGLIDLVVTTGVTDQPRVCLLYHNSGNGTFTKVTNTSVTAVKGNWNAPVWGDFDSDGHPDLFIPSDVPAKNSLYRNLGNGDFAEVTSLPGRDGIGIAALWSDFNEDGFLDLTVGGYLGVTKLYENLGDGTFTKRAFGAGNARPTGMFWNLYSDAGSPEFLSIDFDDPNTLWQRNPDGSLSRLPAPASPFTKLSSGEYVSAIAEDFRNSGSLDVFIATGNTTALANLYFRNNGDGTFTQLTSTNEVGDIVGDRKIASGCAAADYDNDGYLDLFVANSGNGRNETNFVYHSRGDGTFERVNLGSLSSDSAESWGCAWGDYDNDGFMDLYVANGGFVDRGAQTGFLYHNNGNTNHWLKLKLEGTVSNRSAIGATVRLLATIKGQKFWQRRDVPGGGNFFSHSDQRPNFGLGDATNAETVRIEWPSGIVQELHNVTANQILTLTEPPKLEIKRDRSVQITCWQGFNPAIELSTDMVHWTPLTTLSITNMSGKTGVQDPNVGFSPVRFFRAVLR